MSTSVRVESVSTPADQSVGRERKRAPGASGELVATDYHVLFAAALARLSAVPASSPEPGEAQVEALESLAGLAAQGSFALRFYDDVLKVDGNVVPTLCPQIAELAYRLAAQSVAEVAVARGAEPLELLALAKGLAEPPGLSSAPRILCSAFLTTSTIVTKG
jgi:hypothetical protein